MPRTPREAGRRSRVRPTYRRKWALGWFSATRREARLHRHGDRPIQDFGPIRSHQRGARGPHLGDGAGRGPAPRRQRWGHADASIAVPGPASHRSTGEPARPADPELVNAGVAAVARPPLPRPRNQGPSSPWPPTTSSRGSVWSLGRGYLYHLADQVDRQGVPRRAPCPCGAPIRGPGGCMGGNAQGGEAVLRSSQLPGHPAAHTGSGKSGFPILPLGGLACSAPRSWSVECRPPPALEGGIPGQGM